ncbi:MAG: cell division protein FtsL [Hyphomicrobiaceae bacterium]|nr:cell division protein FtsL [Hyphomicrobiaceae bacterium]
MRVLMLAAVLLTIVSAYGLYATNAHTRRLEVRVQAQANRLLAVKSEIAALKAERAHLVRPDRLSQEARALGLRPASPEQYEVVPELASR